MIGCTDNKRKKFSNARGQNLGRKKCILIGTYCICVAHETSGLLGAMEAGLGPQSSHLGWVTVHRDCRQEDG